MLLLWLDEFIERDLQISAVNFVTCVTEEVRRPQDMSWISYPSSSKRMWMFLCSSWVFYLSLAQQSGWSRNQRQRCPGPPSTPPLPDVYIPFRFNFCFADAGKLLAGLKEIYSCLHVQICELVGSHYFMTRTW